MRLTQVPNGEWYLQKGKHSKGNSFTFIARATSENYGMLHIKITNPITVPKNMIGKKIMFKAEVIK